VVWRATLADLFTFGLPGATATPEPRSIASVDPSTGRFELPGHALFGGERARVRAEGDGAYVPTGIDPRRFYDVAEPDDADFFALTLNGSPVSFSDCGAGVLVLLVDLRPKMLRVLAARTSYVVAHFKAYQGPWTTPPDWAPLVVAQLAAYDIAGTMRVSSPQYSLDQLEKRAMKAEAFCARGDAGVPYEDGTGPVDATPNEAEMGARAFRLKGRGLLEGPTGNEV